MSRPTPILIRAAAAVDGAGVALRPAALRIGADGRWDKIAPPEDFAGDSTPVLDLPDTLVLPAMVNTHAHLDLTDLGPQPYGGDFAAWLDRITPLRLGGQSDESIVASVRAGLQQSRAAGVGWVGDIAGSILAAATRLQAPPDLQLPGVSYVECFGIGRMQVDGLARLARAWEKLPPLPPQSQVRLGVSPHAPYTVGLALYQAVTQWARQRDLPLCTHLAESPAESAYIRDLTGVFADRRRQRGGWDDTLRPTGQHPIDWLEPVLRQGDWLLAHANLAQPQHIPLLRRCGASVVYCPLASAYFGFPSGAEHPYRALLTQGVNVCLGTDSILCQPPDEPQPMGLLAALRFLYHRDRTEPLTLLRMATVNGLQALGFPPRQATLTPGVPARWLGVRIDPHSAQTPWVQALTNQAPARAGGDILSA